jgi:hypothetical protein
MLFSSLAPSASVLLRNVGGNGLGTFDVGVLLGGCDNCMGKEKGESKGGGEFELHGLRSGWQREEGRSGAGFIQW